MGQAFEQFMNRDRFGQARNQRGAMWIQDYHAKLIGNEMKLYKISPNALPKHLGLLFDALKSIKPTSVEPERAFSAMGFFQPKNRNRMADSTLDSLITMRQFYQKPRKSEDSDSEDE